MVRKSNVTTAARVVQIVALITLVGIIFIDSANKEFEVQLLVYGGLIGTILGADPGDIFEWLFGRYKK